MDIHQIAIVILITLALKVCCKDLEINHWGTHFVFSVLEDTGTNNPRYIILITARENTKGRVIFHQTQRINNFTLNSGDFKEVVYRQEIVPKPYTMVLPKKAISVESSVKVSVYVYMHVYERSEAFLALPVPSLGYDYLAVNIETQSRGETSKPQIIIISVEDNTDVVIYLKAQDNNKCKNGSVWQSFNNGDVLAFSMKAYDVVNILCSKDTTGSRVKSTKPVAVISGSGSVPLPRLAKEDPVVEMLPPVTELGTEFKVIAPHGHRYRALLRMVALENQTSVSVKNRVILLHAGEWRHVYLDQSEKLCFSSTKPILSVLFMTGRNEDRHDFTYDGDAYMTIIPPVNKYTNDYMIHTDILNDYNSMKNQIDIITATTTLDNIEPLLPFTSLCSNYSVFSSSPQREVKRFKSSTPFLLLVYGFRDKQAYGFPAGMNIADVSGEDECSSSPCQNEGWCLEVGSSYRCYCYDSRYSGSQCEIVITTTTVTTEKPFTEQPTTETASTHTPSTEQPSTGPPSTEQPSTETAFTAKTSTVTASTRPPSTEQLFTEQPSTEKASTAQTSTEQPSTGPPSTEQPSTETASTAQTSTVTASTGPPSTEQLFTEQPSTEKASTAQTSTEQPSTGPPFTIQLYTEQPSTKNPSTEPASTEPPFTKTISTETPAPEQPFTTTPSTETASTKQPTTEHPSTETHSTEQSLTEQPSTETPTTKNPNTSTISGTQLFSTATRKHASTLTSKQTATASSKQTTTLTVPVTSNKQFKTLCRCLCHQNTNKTIALVKAETLQKLLLVEKQALSKTLRKKTSSDNISTSENSLGISSVLFVFMIIGCVILTDFTRFGRWIIHQHRDSRLISKY